MPDKPGDDKSKIHNSVQWVYIIAIVLWIILIIMLRLYEKNDWLCWIMIIIPIILFIIGYINAKDITPDVEGSVFQSDYLSLGLIIIVPLLTWINKDYGGDRRRFIAILVSAVILNLISMIDLWLPARWLSVVKHAKSVLQTMSVFLIIYALYQYYLEKPQNIFC